MARRPPGPPGPACCCRDGKGARGLGTLRAAAGCREMSWGPNPSCPALPTPGTTGRHRRQLAWAAVASCAATASHTCCVHPATQGARYRGTATGRAPEGRAQPPAGNPRRRLGGTQRARAARPGRWPHPAEPRPPASRGAGRGGPGRAWAGGRKYGPRRSPLSLPPCAPPQRSAPCTPSRRVRWPAGSP